jgi:hypothetical protein
VEIQHEQAIVTASQDEGVLRTQVETLRRELQLSRQSREELEMDVERGMTRERSLKDQLSQIQNQRRYKKKRHSRKKIILLEQRRCNCM